ALDDLLARGLQCRLFRLRRWSGELDPGVGDARHPQRLRDRAAASRRGGRDVGATDGDSAGDRPDAQAPNRAGAAMSTVAVDTALPSSHSQSQAQRAVRRRRYLTTGGTALLSLVLVVWTVLPIYNTLLIGSLTSFSIGRLRIRHGWLVSNAALLTYVIPASFLAIPFYRIMQNYGLANNVWSVIAALVAFATPYAIFVFQEYGRSIPIEVDESARIDGASPMQLYLRIYLPLMAPALVAVGTYALLLAWNEYL